MYIVMLAGLAWPSENPSSLSIAIAHYKRTSKKGYGHKTLMTFRYRIMP